jgi:hypothetical protein
MHRITLLTTAVTHQLYRAALTATGRAGGPGIDSADAHSDARDRGAVSLEQVLWFVAAGVSVAVIAGVLWSQIKDRADDPITPPAAP